MQSGRQRAFDAPFWLEKAVAASSGGLCAEAFGLQYLFELHTLKEWNSVMADVNQLNRFVKKNNDFVRCLLLE